jgi:hypothetical protein
MLPRHCERSEAIHVSTCGAVDCFVALLLAMTDAASANLNHLAPLAGRGIGRLRRPFLRTPKRGFGYVASPDAIRVRATLRESSLPAIMPKQPLTPTLSSQGRGEEGKQRARYRNTSPVAASSSPIACAALATLIVVMPIARAGFKLTPRSSR